MPNNNKEQFQFDDLIVDTGKRRVLRENSTLEISGLTYDLLLAIVQASPNIISSDELVEKVWSGRPTSPETITQRAMMLRQALDDSAESPRYIEVVRGQGFRLIPEIAANAPAEVKSPPKLRTNYAIPLAIAVVGIAAIFVFKDFGGTSVQAPSTASAPVRRFSMELGELDRLGAGGGSIRTEVALSPDGQRLVYVESKVGGVANSTNLYLRELNQLEAQLIAGTETARRPFFSPDGEWIGFDSDLGTKLEKVSIRGGLKKTLHEGHRLMYGGTWSEDGTIIFSTTSGPSRNSGKLVKVSADGGIVEDVLVSDDGQAFTWPHFLPGGESLLFTSRDVATPSTEGSIEVLTLETGQRIVLIPGAYNAQYSRTGHVVYTRGDTLWAAPFDIESLEVTGAEVPLFDGIEHNSQMGDAVYDFSDDGLLVYLLGDEANTGSTDTRVPIWIDRDGGTEPIDVPPADYYGIEISPDGTQAAVTINGETGFDVWTLDLERETSSRLTFAPSADAYPFWSPDGDQIIYTSQNNGGGLFSRAANGTGSPELINRNDVAYVGVTISPDGEQLVVLDRFNNESDMYTLSVEGESFPQPFVITEFNEDSAEISPDGKYIAYDSNETGDNEVYVRTFPNPDGGRWQISTNGGADPKWNPSGGELFFRGPGTAEIFSVDVKTEPSFSRGEPRLVATGQFNPGANYYDVSPDGQRFLTYQRVDDETDDDVSSTKNTRLAIVENWFEELKNIKPTE